MAVQTAALQKAIEEVEQLSLEEQAYLLDVIYRRLIESRRRELVNQVSESRQAYRLGEVKMGTVDDLLAELPQISADAIAIEIPQTALKSLCQRYHIKEMSLFGSAIRDDFSPDSDIDILVEFEASAEIDLLEFSGLRLELMEIFDREVDLVTPSALKPLIKDDVLTNKVTIYAV